MAMLRVQIYGSMFLGLWLYSLFILVIRCSWRPDLAVLAKLLTLSLDMFVFLFSWLEHCYSFLAIGCMCCSSVVFARLTCFSPFCRLEKAHSVAGCYRLSGPTVR